jgi:hypothetical protein
MRPLPRAIGQVHEISILLHEDLDALQVTELEVEDFERAGARTTNEGQLRVHAQPSGQQVTSLRHHRPSADEWLARTVERADRGRMKAILGIGKCQPESRVRDDQVFELIECARDCL